jgi:hypothetical protein
MVMLGVLAVAAAAFGAGWALGRDGPDEADAFAHDLEAWGVCLADAGATVPDVRARDDGGLTLEFGPGFFEAFEFDRFVFAAAECREIVGLEELVGLLGLPREPLGGEGLFELNRIRELEELLERFRGGIDDFDLFDADPGRDDAPLSDLLEQLQRRAEGPLLEFLGDLPPGQLERLCRGIFGTDRPATEDEDIVRRLARICRVDR